ncbi:TnsD family Tn7-like transposition protein [Geomonas limicola]|uniref:TnsD family Tn7-like transposition protein n=1 Tax=Geomonas limicola TaxID=2740186 RepID=UPI001615552F|nr:TnsD family Tn7-like transposition protein [Geomonas limicola]
MLPFFPHPYPNELLYSTIARYHFRSKNPSYRDTAQELLGSPTASVIALLPSNTVFLHSQLHPNTLLTPDKLIFEHTLFPLYKPFIEKDRADSAIRYMKRSSVGDGRPLTGLLRYSLSAGRSFKYCPQCFASDTKTHGEAYWHRDHQHFGVLTCYKHNSLLVDTGFPLAPTQQERILYRLDKEYPRQTAPPNFTRKDMRHLEFIAKSVHWLMHNPAPDNAMEILHRRYEQLLVERKFATQSGLVAHRPISKAFDSYYGERILVAMSSSLPMATDKNWLVRLFRRREKVTDPIRHILAIRFLREDIPGIFSETKEQNLPIPRPPQGEDHLRQSPKDENALSCKFCPFTIPKIFRNKAGKVIGPDSAHLRMSEHVEKNHPEEYEKRRRFWEGSPEPL